MILNSIAHRTIIEVQLRAVIVNGNGEDCGYDNTKCSLSHILTDDNYH